jgi:hypothetical protein
VKSILGDPLLWPSLHSTCRRELGSYTLLLLLGIHVTKTCIVRAQVEQHQGQVYDFLKALNLTHTSYFELCNTFGMLICNIINLFES